MAFWNFLTKRGTVRIPLTPEEAREQGSTMAFRRQWECPCGARLSIRAKDSRRDGPSNYVENPRSPGHSLIPSGMLNWNGMAEERGWQTGDRVKCPACRAGMSVKEFKQMRAVAGVGKARIVR